jgi:hypothetical protein
MYEKKGTCIINQGRAVLLYGNIIVLDGTGDWPAPSKWSSVIERIGAF